MGTAAATTLASLMLRDITLNAPPVLSVVFFTRLTFNVLNLYVYNNL